jgi:hypothetical protein
VATSAREMSARTGAAILLQILFDIAKPDRTIGTDTTLRPFDRVLNAPTSEAWFDPWRAFLAERGVTFVTGAVVSLGTAKSGGTTRVNRINIRQGSNTKAITVSARDNVVIALALDDARRVIKASGRVALEPELARFLDAKKSVVRNGAMNGIQFFFPPKSSVPTTLIQGHYLLVESPWAITAVAQDKRWWRTSALSPGGVLSVIISDWDTPSPVTGRAARRTPDGELGRELWRQLTEAIPQLAGVVQPPFVVDPGMSWGTTSRRHTEKMLVNTVGAWRERPHAGLTGQVSNLTIAGDFVRGVTDFASMELANETARRAVRVILQRDGLQGGPLVAQQLSVLNFGALFGASVQQITTAISELLNRELGLNHEPVDDPLQAWLPRCLRSDATGLPFDIDEFTRWIDRITSSDYANGEPSSTLPQDPADAMIAARTLAANVKAVVDEIDSVVRAVYPLIG